MSGHTGRKWGPERKRGTSRKATEKHTRRKRRYTQEGNLGTYRKEIANMQIGNGRAYRKEIQKHAERKSRNIQEGDLETHRKEIEEHAGRKWKSM